MLSSKSISLFYFITIAFIAAIVCGIVNEFYLIMLVPVAIGVVYLAIAGLDKVILLAVFCTPLAINLKQYAFGVGLSVPTEPLTIGLMLIFLFKLLLDPGFDNKILKHPVTIIITINLLWMLITCITSTMFIVSIKYFLVRLWFVSVFYFLCTQLFIDIKKIKVFIWLYTIPMILTIIYTILRHYKYSFSEQSAHWVMTPFYNDHTAYAVVIAMFIPIIVFFAFNKAASPRNRFWSKVAAFILVLAVILSYTRAAWIGLAAALGIYLLLVFRIKFKVVLIVICTAIVLFFAFRPAILMLLKENRQDSSSDYASHLKSMTNISTDASNLERINRWHSALRMFAERPTFGWGPGTYMFQYAPFQDPNEKTIISTNNGTMGNAHSEYIGPLAESGVLGSLSFIMILVIVSYKGRKLYLNSKNKELRGIILSLLLGLITYWIHGTLNNFLDTDKASVPFWGFIAMIVALDVYHKDKLEPALTKQ